MPYHPMRITWRVCESKSGLAPPITAPDLLGPERGQKICISNRFPGGANAVDLGTTL